MSSPSKSQPLSEKNASELEKKIIRQVEYYFGNANLMKDKFLKEEINKEGEDGWVSMDTMLKFQRLLNLSDDKSVIVSALRKSTKNIVQVKEDGSAIRRNPGNPLPVDDAEYHKNLKQRLLYMKGFPKESTLDEVITFLEDYGVESVQMKTDIHRKFKGSIFALFNSKEYAQKFLAAEKICYGDSEIIERKTKENYFKLKNEGKLSKKKDEVKRKEELKLQKEKEEQEELRNRITKCSVLKVTGLSNNATIESVKEFFGKFGSVSWVDFIPDEKALVRFATENEAQVAWEKALAEFNNDKVKLGEDELQGTPLEGVEEEEHWKNVFLSMRDKYNKSGSRGGYGGRGGRGWRGGKFKGNRGKADGEPANKRAKLDA